MSDFPMHLAPKPTLRGWSHRLAFLTAIVLCPILISSAQGARTLAVLYSTAIICLFGVSSFYHGHSWSRRAHDIWRRCDHAMIFIAIAATYTPISWLMIPKTDATLVLLVVWIGALTGVLVMIFWPSAPKSVLIPLFIIVGWSALLVIDELWKNLGGWGFTFLLLGGALHTSGAVIYGMQKPDPWPSKFGFHEIFHLLVVFAITSHYVIIAFIALPNA
ncbi:MAG: hemolysin III [Acidimicrobiaceae bacterium]|nr:hemolysin III [Acidimicrobiaceae bacterium]